MVVSCLSLVSRQVPKQREEAQSDVLSAELLTAVRASVLTAFLARATLATSFQKVLAAANEIPMAALLHLLVRQ